MAELIKDLIEKDNTDNIVRPNIVSANIPSNAVTTSKIADGAITDAKIADGAITSDHLDTNSVDTINIIDGAVTTAKIDNYAITAIKLDNQCVTEDKIASQAITNAKIEYGTITTDRFSFSLYRHIILLTFDCNGSDYIARKEVLSPLPTLSLEGQIWASLFSRMDGKENNITDMIFHSTEIEWIRINFSTSKVIVKLYDDNTQYQFNFSDLETICEDYYSISFDSIINFAY